MAAVPNCAREAAWATAAMTRDVTLGRSPRVTTAQSQPAAASAATPARREAAIPSRPRLDDEHAAHGAASGRRPPSSARAPSRTRTASTSSAPSIASTACCSSGAPSSWAGCLGRGRSARGRADGGNAGCDHHAREPSAHSAAISAATRGPRRSRARPAPRARRDLPPVEPASRPSGPAASSRRSSTSASKTSTSQPATALRRRADVARGCAPRRQAPVCRRARPSPDRPPEGRRPSRGRGARTIHVERCVGTARPQPTSAGHGDGGDDHQREADRRDQHEFL